MSEIAVVVALWALGRIVLWTARSIATRAEENP